MKSTIQLASDETRGPKRERSNIIIHCSEPERGSRLTRHSANQFRRGDQATRNSIRPNVGGSPKFPVEMLSNEPARTQARPRGHVAILRVPPTIHPSFPNSPNNPAFTLTAAPRKTNSTHQRQPPPSRSLSPDLDGSDRTRDHVDDKSRAILEG